MRRFYPDWTVGFTRSPDVRPEKMVPAVVPGAAQLDWCRSEGGEDFRWSDNCLELKWMENVCWVYECLVSRPQLESNQRLVFTCGGVDYRFAVNLDGNTIHAQEGMFTPFELDLGDMMRDVSCLQIIVFPVGDDHSRNLLKQGLRSKVKPICQAGNSCHPAVASIGIWKDTFFDVKSDVFVTGFDSDYVLDDAFRFVDLAVALDFNEKLNGSIQWSLTDSRGEVVDACSLNVEKQNGVSFDLHLEKPSLWWPNGIGNQNLYTLIVSLHGSEGEVLDRQSKRIGFRKSRLIPNEDVDSDCPHWEHVRGHAAIALEINGQRVFCKGANWMPMDVFPGAMDEESYRALLDKAKEAHFNILRCWGGGVVNKPSFFNLCDEMGIMVWQEFPLAEGRYTESAEFLLTLDNEARSIVRSIREHPCLAIWGGGSDLLLPESGMSDQHKAIRLLNRVCYELDPDTPFLSSAPMMGMSADGCAFRVSENEECFQAIQQCRSTAYLSLGCSGPASMETLNAIIPEDERFPPRGNGAWKIRHAFVSSPYCDRPNLDMETIERYFGHAESLDEVVELGQLLQVEACKALFEEARRQKPFCSMALAWTLNEPWPSAAGPSLLSWPCEPKPAYHAVKQSCRPVLASARVSKFSWKDGEWFEAELWVLNDLPQVVKGERMEASLRFDDDEIFVLAWDFDPIEPYSNLPGPVLKYRIPEIDGRTFKLILRVDSRPEWNTEYTFCFKSTKPFLSDQLVEASEGQPDDATQRHF